MLNMNTRHAARYWIAIATLAGSLGLAAASPAFAQDKPPSLGQGVGNTTPTAAVGAAAASATAALTRKCATLSGMSLDATTTIISATVVAGTFTPPGSAMALADVPELCRVVGVSKPTADSSIKFEVWLPTSGWNTKFLSSFEPGFAGFILYSDMLQLVRRGYAAAGTDTGHSVADTTWMIGHPERVVDFGHRGKHLQTLAAKALIKVFYGQAPTRSYFAGCSNGGRQGMMELERYPDDYDGYVLGAPANNWTGQTTYWALMNQVFSDPVSRIPDAKLPAIHAAALAQCDASDGVVDQLISNPRMCAFKPEVLACAVGQDSSQCLTAPQLTALTKIYQGPRDSAGRQLFPGNEAGAETANGNWSSYVTNPAGARTRLGAMSVGGMLHNKADYDVMTFNFDADPSLLERQLGSILNATNPNLRAQKAKGVKILQYHGWSDAALPPQESVNNYERVIAAMGGLTQTQDFYKLYMVPGMVHCSGGPGPNSFGQPLSAYQPASTAKNDIIKALEQWVEKGEAPDAITATKYEGDLPSGRIMMQRPLCAYPKVQKYIGGDPAKETSFACTM